MKPIYINGMGSISSQPMQDWHSFLNHTAKQESNAWKCIEPDYTPFLAPKTSRRLSRILKFGTTAGLMAMQNSGLKNVDAISTATGLGLLEDSGKFLQSLIDLEEGVLSPTSFIQSTHNTVSGNLALLLGCEEHNWTFSQRYFSLESAILNAQLLLADDHYKNILVGSYDEITSQSLEIFAKSTIKTNFSLGEGAHFFVLSNEKTENTFCKIKNVHFGLNFQTENVINFLNQNKEDLSSIDLIIYDSDQPKKIYENKPLISTHDWSGEYFTNLGFTIWVAANILKMQQIPPFFNHNMKPSKLTKVLIHKEFNDYSSLILLSHE